MADVFISYKRESRARVEVMASRLSDLGLAVWFDASLLPGERFDHRIEEEATRARAIIVCWTPAAIQSEWVLREAEIGRSGKKLIPVRLEACVPPAPFQMLEATDLTSWDGGVADTNWLKVLRRLEKPTGARLVEQAKARAGGQQDVVVDLLRGMLVRRAKTGANVFTYAGALAALRKRASRRGVELNSFSQPMLWGALDVIAEQNRQRREPCLAVLVVSKDTGKPGRGYFQKHGFLKDQDDKLADALFKRHLERVHTFDWSADILD